MSRLLVCGAGGFIGHHLVTRLKNKGHTVIGVDLKKPEFSETEADLFYVGDLRDQAFCNDLFKDSYDEIYQLAADMGGAGYIFIGDNDAQIMHNSSQINLNILDLAAKNKVKKIFYSSSACIYPEHNQLDPLNPNCEESSAYPASPDSEYGWEKLFSERLYLAYAKNFGIQVRIARYHNIFGPQGSWNNGKEKSPAALCRKVAMAEDGGSIEIWGDGHQTRSFLYIDECLEGTMRLMASNWTGPVNIGSDEMISIEKLANLIIKVSGKNLKIRYVDGPLGVRGRNSNNDLIEKALKWTPSMPLAQGIESTYSWILGQAQLLTKKKLPL
jgi:nucleoside-diphosphate-sugar epimerase